MLFLRPLWGLLNLDDVTGGLHHRLISAAPPAPTI